MPDPITDPRSGRPYCFDCGHRLARKGICWNCYDREIQDPPEQAQNDLETFKNYQGDRWIVDGWIEYGHSEAEAIAEAQHPSYIGMLLWAGRLDEILADRVATAALRQLLITNHKGTLENLAAWIERVRNPDKRTKRGPRPKDGVYIEQEVLRMKRAGKTTGQIAKKLGTKKATVAAAYNNITNKIARQQRATRDNLFRQ